MQPRKIVWAAFAALLAIAIPLRPAAAQDKTVTVFAAASMKNALDDADAAYTKSSGVKVVASYDASSALIKQIENGAPADVFVSADLNWMDYGSQKKLINDGTRVNLLGNKLVLIAPKDSKIDNVTIGIVYSTDAKVEPGVKIVGVFPDDTHPPIIYPVAATVNAKPDAIPYLAFLRSQAAKTIFESYGFTVLAKPTS